MPDRKRQLNLGCGVRWRPECINVDLLLSVRPQVVCDLDHKRLPFAESSFDAIFVHDVIEHLDDIPAFIAEAHALLAGGGVLEITTPHFSSANSFTDPTHRHHLGYFSFDYFTDSSPWNFYTPVRFDIIERNLVLHPGRLQRLVAWYANRWPAAYERSFCWLWPAWFLIVRLRARKD
jgi:SAM-dependent methyltransferase